MTLLFYFFGLFLSISAMLFQILSPIPFTYGLFWVEMGVITPESDVFSPKFGLQQAKLGFKFWVQVSLLLSYTLIFTC